MQRVDTLQRECAAKVDAATREKEAIVADTVKECNLKLEAS